MKKHLPVYLGFFVMGFADVVGIATNYAKKDLALRDAIANLLPFMVFIWFALFSVPVGMLMNRIGRRKTVLLGMAITVLAMLVPLVDYNFVILLVAFALVGIGNTILQVSLNPLLADLVPSPRLPGALSAGQFIKAIASFLGPVIAGAASAWLKDWKLIFLVFAATSALSALWLWVTPIVEHSPSGRASSFRDCVGLLKDPFILQLLFSVVAIVGLDVGLNTTLPRFLMARCGLPIEQAGLGTSLYFIARTTGSLAGIFLLAKAKARRIYLASALTGFLALTALLFTSPLPILLPLIFLIGFSIANIFPVLFAAALHHAPTQQNEVSGLLIMGVAGGAILPPIMGVIGDAYGAAAALGSLLVAWGYLGWVGRRLSAT